MTQDEQIKKAVEETTHELEIMRKLKYYSYVIMCTTETTKCQVVRGVGLNFKQAQEILNKWNAKNEQEGQPKLECIAILEGDYARDYSCDSHMIVPSKHVLGSHKYSREELYQYYKRICEILNI